LDSKDYLDVYLYGVKQIENYDVTFDDTSITITFTESITRIPTDVVAEFNDPTKPSPFNIRGKITEIV